MVGAGGIYSHFTTEDKNKNVLEDSGYGFGWQVDFVGSFTAKKHMLLMPYFRFKSLTKDLLIQHTTTTGQPPYFAQGLAVSWYF